MNKGLQELICWKGLYQSRTVVFWPAGWDIFFLLNCNTPCAWSSDLRSPPSPLSVPLCLPKIFCLLQLSSVFLFLQSLVRDSMTEPGWGWRWCLSVCVCVRADACVRAGGVGVVSCHCHGAASYHTHITAVSPSEEHACVWQNLVIWGLKADSKLHWIKGFKS